MKQTNIQWCDSTINFWQGCTKVSAGCQHCYAEARDARFYGYQHRADGRKALHWGKDADRLKTKGAVKQAFQLNRYPFVCSTCGKDSSHWNDGNCIHCHKIPGYGGKWHRRRIFSLSLGDWLDPDVPIEWLSEMLETIHACSYCEWILCTKRPELWRKRIAQAFQFYHETLWLGRWLGGDAPKNITLLASVENQQAADERYGELIAIPAARRGFSVEPLLEDVDLHLRHGCRGCNHPGNIMPAMNEHGRCSACDGTGHEPSGIDWVIVGGESGPGARPCNTEWIRSVVKQGKESGAAVFVKQLGANPMHNYSPDFDDIQLVPMSLKDKKGGDPDEWPEDLRIQEWPRMETTES